jgi:carotenoid cleavage dioxygenase-like enzyme
MKTGTVTEGPLEAALSEFGMINPVIAGKPYQYSWAMTTKPGWYLFDGLVRLDATTGQRQQYKFPEGVYGSESPMAPSPTGESEDDGYVLTFTTDMNTNSSHCQIFDARDIETGPIAKVALPQKICVGTHSYWAGS